MVDTTYTIRLDGETATAEASLTNPESVTLGETASYDFELSDSAYDTLAKYRDYAGSYSEIELLSGDQRYRDQLPAGATISSLLVGIEPSSDLQADDVPGVWGVIDGIADIRDITLSTTRLRVTVYVLAPLERYADHTTAENNLRR